MNKLIKILSVLCVTSVFQTAYATSDCPYRLSDLKTQPYTKIKAFSQADDCNNFDLLSEFAYKKKVNHLLATYAKGLTLDDFDMGEVVDQRNFDDMGIFTTYFWQKNKSYQNHDLKIYVSYDLQKDQSLIVLLTSEDEQTYILGDNNYFLLDEIIRHRSFDRSKLIHDELFGAMYEMARQGHN